MLLMTKFLSDFKIKMEVLRLSPFRMQPPRYLIFFALKKQPQHSEN